MQMTYVLQRYQEKIDEIMKLFLIKFCWKLILQYEIASNYNKLN